MVDMKKFILILLFLSFSISNAEKKVLFIGNSISEPWLELRLKELADSADKDLRIQTLSFGGFSLSDHVKSETTHQWIDSLDWDYVVLQQGPGILALDSATCDQYMFDAVDSLYYLIKQNNPCTEVVFFMSWAVDDADTNPAPDVNYFRQQETILQNTVDFAKRFFCMTAPVGRAWKEVRVDKPWILLYRDIVHANHTGHFLNACVFYTLFFRELPNNVKNSVFVSEFISDTLADYLKDLAGYVVLDNLDKWNYFVNVPESDFTFQKQGMTVDFFSEKVSPALRHFWYFDDGSCSEKISPAHEYYNQGEYEVSHIVESDCYLSDTAIMTINLISGLEDELSADDIKIYPNPNDGKFRIEFGNEIPNEIRIFDVLGRDVYLCKNKFYHLDIHLDVLSPAIYYLRINQKKNYKIIIVK